jgi:RNA polymerase sigma factor (sigma-70 family)
MQDAEMVAAIVTGQTSGLAEAYDRYAPALHAYCRSLLDEPADADDAVQDTFMIAAAKLGRLRDRSRLRPWLYAVARNECRRRLRSRASSAPPGGAREVSDETIDLGVDAANLELRALVEAALAGLGPGDREIIELNLRHELAGPDLAAALGVGTKQANALASQARSQFATSLGALLVAYTERESCPELAEILSGWDGRLNVLLRKRINRHIEHCARCRARSRRELSPAALLGALPVPPLPGGVHDRLFRLATDASPAASAQRAEVMSHAGQFGPAGFPEPLDPPQVPHRVKPYALAATAGVAALAVAATMLYGGVLTPHSHGPAAAGPGTGPSVAPAAAAPSAVAGAGPRHSAGTIPLVAGAAANPPPATSPPVVVAVTPSARPSASRSPRVAPTSASPSPVAGTLTASVAALHLRLNVATSFTLTAQGGPVSKIQIQNPDPLHLTISLGAGSLAAGQSTTVTVTMVNLLRSSSTLLVDPGGLTITVRSGLLR